MSYYRFLLKPSSRLPKWLTSNQELFTISENGRTWVYLALPDTAHADAILDKTSTLLSYESVSFDQEINWEKQWSIHSPHYKDGYLQLDLSSTLKLKLSPGPGFGDLSHPTTRMMLKLLAPFVKGAYVIDIGCGSGILSLAALLLGAKSAIGIDIDPHALEHANKNAQLNHLETYCSFQLPGKFVLHPTDNIVILMNMISSEQSQAWGSLPHIHHLPCMCFTSGVLVSDRDLYLQECDLRNWELLQEIQEEDWLCFQFRNHKLTINHSHL